MKQKGALPYSQDPEIWLYILHKNNSVYVLETTFLSVNFNIILPLFLPFSSDLKEEAVITYFELVSGDE
jgi:hypothetical protein